MIYSKNPLVSVIIPAYNAGKYIRDAVDSILSQTYKNIEIIIINDASTDNTLKIIKNYGDKNKNITIHNNKVNMGVGANRTIGIGLAKGKYICWQDADDISLPNRVKNQLNYLINHEDVGAVGGFINFFDDNGDGVIRRYEETDSALRSKIFRYSPVAQPASMVKAEVYSSIGVFNSSYVVAEDLEMSFRIGTKYHFANIQEVVLKYRQTANSLTRLNLRKMEMATLELRKKYSKNKAYNYTLIDWLYNVAQRISMILPPNMRMLIFKIIRGDK